MLRKIIGGLLDVILIALLVAGLVYGPMQMLAVMGALVVMTVLGVWLFVCGGEASLRSLRTALEGQKKIAKSKK